MVVETTFITDISSNYFQTAIDAAAIVTAFKTGKTIIVHLPHSEDSAEFGIYSDMYLRMMGYLEPYHNYDIDTDVPASFGFPLNSFDVQVLENGKLGFVLQAEE